MKTLVISCHPFLVLPPPFLVQFTAFPCVFTAFPCVFTEPSRRLKTPPLPQTQGERSKTIAHGLPPPPRPDASTSSGTPNQHTSPLKTSLLVHLSNPSCLREVCW